MQNGCKMQLHGNKWVQSHSKSPQSSQDNEGATDNSTTSGWYKCTLAAWAHAPYCLPPLIGYLGSQVHSPPTSPQAPSSL
ncbi:hypothetical protein HaLaN_27977 [Haematococcus lacustris]|uniref:Uncharacterized protein n=1 Tax=Haematococcus lacustris TaxID=44745 RepID=A0A6A0A9L3_HAELA|nr:hypothetical protein HaLaN_27977 [Haematococcus lacustris]